MTASAYGLLISGGALGALFLWGWWEMMREELNMNKPDDAPLIKPTYDNAAMVNTKVRWIRIAKCPPPGGAKVLLINKHAGVATIGELKDGWFTHWQALPVFGDDE